MSVSIQGVDEWFVASGYLASIRIKNHPQGLQFAQLPPTVRLLLATDGTVTKSLEALFWEPVAVDLDRQTWVTCTPPWSQNTADTATLLDRRVFLKGEHSHRFYSFAKSYVNADCLDTHLRSALLNEQMGIGELLRTFYYEQYRKIMDIGWHQPKKNMKHPVLSQHCVYRTYTVTSQRQTLMQITEYFPVDLFASSTPLTSHAVQAY